MTTNEFDSVRLTTGWDGRIWADCLRCGEWVFQGFEWASGRHSVTLAWLIQCVRRHTSDCQIESHVESQFLVPYLSLRIADNGAAWISCEKCRQICFHWRVDLDNPNGFLETARGYGQRHLDMCSERLARVAAGVEPGVRGPQAPVS